MTKDVVTEEVWKQNNRVGCVFRLATALPNPSRALPCSLIREMNQISIDVQLSYITRPKTALLCKKIWELHFYTVAYLCYTIVNRAGMTYERQKSTTWIVHKSSWNLETLHTKFVDPLGIIIEEWKIHPETRRGDLPKRNDVWSRINAKRNAKAPNYWWKWISQNLDCSQDAKRHWRSP